MRNVKTSVKNNFIYNVIYDVLIMFVPLVTTPYVARVLGAEKVGIYDYVTANTTYFILIAAFGAASYAQREIAFNRDDKENLSREFWGIFSFRLVSTAIAVIAFLVFFFINDKYSSFYLVSAISIISVAADVSWFFQGVENFKTTIIRNAVVKVLAAVLIFVFVRNQNGLLLYFVINVCSTFCGNCSLWPFLRNNIYSFKKEYAQLKKHFLGSLKLLIPALAIQIYTVVDKTMLGIISGVVEVGYYSQAEKIVKLALFAINSLAIVILPRISNLIANNDFGEANRYYKKAVQFTALLALPSMAGCIIVAKDFIPLFLGKEYIPSVVVFQILSALFVILGLARIIGTPLMIPLKRERQCTKAVCTGAVINFALNLILISRFKAVGAAIATIVAELVVTSLEIYFVRDCFKPDVVFKNLRRYLIPTVVMSAVLVALNGLLPAGIVRLAVSVVSGGVVYFACLLLMRDELLYEQILAPLSRLVGKFKKK